MRKNRLKQAQQNITIFALDDDPIMTSSIQSYFQNVGYTVDTENDPLLAIERIRNGSYDILLLDFLMTPLYGDQVVERVREFNKDLYIILLTGHKSMAPPIRTMRALDIQGYYEKSDRFDQLELLIESCSKSIRQHRVIKKYQSDLAKMADELPKLYELKDIHDMATEILDFTTKLWNSNHTLFALWEEPNASKHQLFTKGDIFADKDANSPRELLTTISEESMFTQLLKNSKGQEVGVLAVLDEEKQDEYAERVFHLFAKQCETLIENYYLMRRVRDNYVDMVKSIRLMVDAKDIYTRGHSDRVSYYAKQLAVSLGKDDEFVERVRIAGLFHDIGKVAVPDQILLSSEKLTDDDWVEMRKHPVQGSVILSGLSSFKEIAPIVRSHHERLDGKGYPDGLHETEIPCEAKIISIADAFDAMTSTRRYRQSMTFDEAVNRLKEACGTQLDKEMVDQFICSVLNMLPHVTSELYDEVNRIVEQEELSK